MSGLKVVMLGGIGPAPFCAMLLADLGADVIRIDRPAPADEPDPMAILARGQRSITLNFKDPADMALARRLLGAADVAIEGFRPGVVERLGLGPEDLHKVNPGLVYGRMTGWGQQGPLAQAPGHDINYIALTGALDAIGSAGGPPVIPLNLIGDFGGGGLFLAFGLMAAIHERTVSGKGQVVDAAMLDGAALLMTGVYALRNAGWYENGRGRNRVDGGSHYYACYECADGKYIAVGAMEPQFYQALREKCGLTDPAFDAQTDETAWPALREKLAAVIRTRPREDWCRLLEGTPACVSPVLDFDDAPVHPHNRARELFIEVGGVIQPAPGPRFSRSAVERPVTIAQPGEHTAGLIAAMERTGADWA